MSFLSNEWADNALTRDEVDKIWLPFWHLLEKFVKQEKVFFVNIFLMLPF